MLITIDGKERIALHHKINKTKRMMLTTAEGSTQKTLIKRNSIMPHKYHILI